MALLDFVQDNPGELASES